MPGFYLNDNLEKVDPDLKQIIDLEAARQNQKLIFIPSESAAPLAVHESMGSILQNIYAEGYPDEASRWFSQEKILDVERHLAHFRRYSDPRYYKGVEFADMIEELARRRCAEAFATSNVSADDIYVNVQPLSGAPANNAVYQALINPGDTILGMNLLHGGHLTHGSSVNRSGSYIRPRITALIRKLSRSTTTKSNASRWKTNRVSSSPDSLPIPGFRIGRASVRLPIKSAPT